MGNILTPLNLVRKRLNEFIRAAHTGARTDEWVVLSNLFDHDSKAHEHCENKIVMFLANIQHETIHSTYQRNQPGTNDNYVTVTAPLYIDLYVLFYANFSGTNYKDGLHMISQVISFFQQSPAFNNDSLPGLDSAIGKLTFEITSLSVTDLNYLMGLIGAKYLPSAYYKVRMIPFQGDAISSEVPAAKGVKTPDSPKSELPSHLNGQPALLPDDEESD